MVVTRMSTEPNQFRLSVKRGPCEQCRAECYQPAAELCAITCQHRESCEIHNAFRVCCAHPRNPAACMPRSCLWLGNQQFERDASPSLAAIFINPWSHVNERRKAQGVCEHAGSRQQRQHACHRSIPRSAWQSANDLRSTRVAVLLFFALLSWGGLT